MVKILYGLCSVGIGHAIRAKVLIEHLRKEHEVMVITSYKAYDLLKKVFPNVHNITGVELVFKENKILNMHTLFKNLAKLGPEMWPRMEKVRKKIYKFSPDLVVSDWEMFSTFIAKMLKKPLVSFDNQHFLVYGKFKVPDNHMSEFIKARIFIYGLVAKAKYHVISYFSGVKVKKKKNVYLVPPVIRDKILKANVSVKNHVVVYQSTEKYQKLLKVLKKIDQKFIVYGYNIAKKEKNLTFKKFDEQSFIKDLVSCKAVICNGGFTLISEAVYLGKPLLVLPITGHFEQVLNGINVKKRRAGEFVKKLSVQNVERFLGRVENYRRGKRKGYNNKKLFWILDHIIKREMKDD